MLPGDGLGWFPLFGAVCATIFGTAFLVHFEDPVSAVMWYPWAVLWFLFFLLLGLHMEDLTIATGWFTLAVAPITATIPALAFSFVMGRRSQQHPCRNPGPCPCRPGPVIHPPSRRTFSFSSHPNTQRRSANAVV